MRPTSCHQVHTVRFGVAIPYYEQYADLETVLAIATRAEGLGFDIVWFADHVALPASDRPRMGNRWFEILTLMAHVAAHVRSAGIGTDVLVVPHRHPVLAAKMLTTLDIVSRGRLIVGIGGGYVKGEFETLDAPFDERGAYTDECIRVWKALWGGGNVSFEGRYFSFSDATAEPTPIQKPHPPIWVGNRGPRVLRRVVELGDGWHPIGLSLLELESSVARLRELWTQAGRAGAPTLSYSGLGGTIAEAPAPQEKRRPLTGAVEQVIGDIEAMKRLGFESVLFRFGVRDGTPQTVIEQMELCASAVLPSVR